MNRMPLLSMSVVLMFAGLSSGQVQTKPTGTTKPSKPATASASQPATQIALPPIRNKIPRVLLIGDSICCYYYSSFVTDLLKGEAEVFGGGHTEGTRTLLSKLDTEKKGTIIPPGGKPWDVIHFNAGLHDVKDHCVVSIEEYEKNLREIVRRLKATGARLIWASTTPVGMRNNGLAADRHDKDVIAYNVVAKKIMDEAGIPIDDLYPVFKAHPEMQKDDGVHPDDAGSKLLAAPVAASIRAAISGKLTTRPATQPVP